MASEHLTYREMSTMRLTILVRGASCTHSCMQDPSALALLCLALVHLGALGLPLFSPGPRPALSKPPFAFCLIRIRMIQLPLVDSLPNDIHQWRRTYLENFLKLVPLKSADDPTASFTYIE